LDRAVIVLNPASRNAPARERLIEAARGLANRGWRVDLQLTAGPGDATRLARDAATSGVSVVFACGGDGTINEVVNGLAGSDTALSVIRGGMGNVFAKEMGIPRRLEAALDLLHEGERHRFDLGLAGGRYFLLMAGIGLDANVVRAVPGAAKRRLGSTSYALWGLREVLRYRPRAVDIELDGERRRVENLYWLLLGNTRSYGGVLDIAGRARADDGLLDAYVFDGRGVTWLLRTFLSLVRRRHEEAAGVTFRRVSRLSIETPGIGVQADGEYFGETPMTFTVAPQALTVLLPRGAADRLFDSKAVEGMA
jgi:YegS/Rv2252/BmrU family lipid kinase